MSGPIDNYLEDLAQRLHRTPALAARVLEEAREHLEESAAEACASGLARDRAEAQAVERFGSARSLARGLAQPRRHQGLRTLALALGLSLFAGLAFAQIAGPPERIGLVTRPQTSRTQSGTPLSGLGETRLVSLDPTTLAPQGNGVALPATGYIRYVGFLPAEVAVRAPGDQQLGIVMDGAVTLYGLRPLGRTGIVRFAAPSPIRGPGRPSQHLGSLDAVRAAAWLANGRIALLVQHQAPPYASRITRRTLVVIDPAARRIVSRTRVDLRGTVGTFAAAADRVVVIACRAGATTLFSADTSGRSSSVATGTPCPPGQSPPALALRRDGSTAALVGSDGSPVIVDLSHQPLHVRRLPKVLDVARGAASSLAMTWVGDSLAITGVLSTQPGKWRARGVGVIMVDPTSGARRMLARRGSRLLVADDALIVSGFDSHGLGRSPGSGITAFTLAGKQVWHSDGARLVRPYAVGQRVYAPRAVKRHTVVDVFDLQTGRATASLFQRGVGVTPLSGVVESIGT